MTDTGNAGAEWLREAFARLDEQNQFFFEPQPEPAEEQSMTAIENYLNNRLN